MKNTGYLLIHTRQTAACRKAQPEIRGLTKRIIVLFLLLVSLHLFVSCDGNVEEVPAGSNDTAGGEKNGEVLAIVNGSAITRDDLAFATGKLLGEESAAELDAAASKKILQSMVMSRAIAQQRLRELSEEEQLLLDREIDAYRENLLVRGYLTKHASPQPISMEMIQEYYDAHPEQFGAATISQYELLTLERPLPPEERDALLAKMREAAQEEDWQQWSTTLATQGYPLTYSRNDSKTNILQPTLSQAIAALAPGQVSAILLVEDIPYVIRVTGQETLPAKSLSEASGDIKKILAPRQIKKSVEQVGQEVLANAEVKYK